jgi:hypothetical protein
VVAEAGGDEEVTLPLSFAVATEGGVPVVDQAWLDGQLAEVERLYGPLGVHFHAPAPRPLSLPLAHVESRADRDALAPAALGKLINVFVVASLRDVDDGVSPRRGVHWRARSSPSLHYVILSSIAGPSVLAHELGHYFGNGHSDQTDNLMSYRRTGAPVFLVPAQVATIHAGVRAALRAGEVDRVVPPAAPSAAP